MENIETKWSCAYCVLVECNADLKFKNTNIHMNVLKLSITTQV